jgi:hypothetical protein
LIRDISSWIIAALLLACVDKSSTKKIDSIAAKSIAASSAATDSYAELAGDTLRLISIGGRRLPAAAGSARPCDSAHRPLSERRILASDSTYWATGVFAPGCLKGLIAAADTFSWRGSYSVEGDTLTSRGSFALVGDTLYMHASVSGEANQFAGIVFPDSVVEIGASAGSVRRYARNAGAAGDPTLMGRIAVDTVMLARDLDGSGKTDYVARISRLGPGLMERETRLAIYLDAEPGSRRPDWVRPSDKLEEEEPTLSRALSIAPGVSLLDIGWSGGDASGDDVLIVEHGQIRTELSHVIDYGNGAYDVAQKGGQTVVTATLSDLELRGKPVTADIKCPDTFSPGIRLTFDAKADTFTPGAPFCIKTYP